MIYFHGIRELSLF